MRRLSPYAEESRPWSIAGATDHCALRRSVARSTSDRSQAYACQIWLFVVRSKSMSGTRHLALGRVVARRSDEMQRALCVADERDAEGELAARARAARVTAPIRIVRPAVVTGRPASAFVTACDAAR